MVGQVFEQTSTPPPPKKKKSEAVFELNELPKQKSKTGSDFILRDIPEQIMARINKEIEQPEVIFFVFLFKMLEMCVFLF